MDLNSLVYNAQYYNFFRRLEESHNDRSFRGRVGLLSKLPYMGTFQLNSMSINALVTDTCTSTTIEQNYTNFDKGAPVEAYYSINVPPYATINSLQVEMEDTILIGKLKEKNTAKNQYDDAIAEGASAFLIEKGIDGECKFSLGNIKPSASVTIRFTVISEIGFHNEYLQYCLHRYWFPNGFYPVSVSIQLSIVNEIQSLQVCNYKYTSSIDSQSSQQQQQQHTLTINCDEGIEKNIVVLIKTKSSQAPLSFIEKNIKPVTNNSNDDNNNSYAVALNFKPDSINTNIDQLKVEQKAEFIFVLDCSGSMTGNRIKLSIRLLQMLLRALPDSVIFNVVAFGSTFETLFPESSMKYNNDTLTQATRFVDDMNKNLGGTDLFKPMKYILDLPYNHEYPRQIFILTDGGVDNKEKLVKYVSKDLSTSRVFTVGIDDSDVDLVKALAVAGGGDHRIVHTRSTDFESGIFELLTMALQPRISNLRMNWGDLSDFIDMVAPIQIRPIYLNERMVLYALINSIDKNSHKLETERIYQVKLIGVGPDGTEIEFPVNLNFSNINRTGNLLHSIGSNIYISNLEHMDEKDKKENHKNEIIKLSLEYSLISKHTSFVVSHMSNDSSPILESPKIINMTHNYIPPSVSLSHASMSNGSSGCCSGGGGGSQYQNTKPIINKPFTPQQSTTLPSSPITVTTTTSEEFNADQSMKNSLNEIIKLQSANGSWNVNESTKSLNVIKCTIEQLDSHQDIWLTIIIIATLETKYQSLKSIYSNSMLKSIKWIKQQLSNINPSSDDNTITYENLLEVAKQELLKLKIK